MVIKNIVRKITDKPHYVLCADDTPADRRDAEAGGGEAADGRHQVTGGTDGRPPPLETTSGRPSC